VANGDIEKQEMGAPKFDPDLEKQIRYEVEKEFSYLTPAEKEAMISSRLKISNPGTRPSLIQVDLGDDASRKIKEDLFE
jgi:hypothetical protein